MPMLALPAMAHSPGSGKVIMVFLCGASQVCQRNVECPVKFELQIKNTQKFSYISSIVCDILTLTIIHY